MRISPSIPGSLLLALLLSPAPRAEADLVKLRFAWEPGLRIDVRAETTLEDKGRTSRLESPGTVLVYRLTAEEAGDALKIVVSDARPEGGPVQQDKAVAFHLGVATAGLADILVAPDGKFTGLADPGGVSSRMRGDLKQVLPRDPPLSPILIDKLRRATLPETIDAAASAWWSEIVGFWAGGDLEIGAHYEAEAPAAHPGFPTETVTSRYRFGAERRLACAEGGAAQDCVELRLVSSIDPAEVAAVAERVIKSLPVGKGDAPHANPRIEQGQELVLVAEPGSLKPHRLEHTQITRVGEGDEQRERVERRRLTFSYPAPLPPPTSGNTDEE